MLKGRQALIKILGDGGQPQAHEDQVADLQANAGAGHRARRRADAKGERPGHATGERANRHTATEDHRHLFDQLQQHRQDLLDTYRGPLALEVVLNDRVGQGHGLAHVVDTLATEVAIGLVGAIAHSAAETVPGLMGAVQAAVDALVELAEFLLEIAFDVSPTGDVG
ncbi:hypothetical protein D9M71_546850 [compost metagenome]